MPELRVARAELTTASGEAPDLVLLGSPHFSLAEFRQLTALLDGGSAPKSALPGDDEPGVAALAEHAGLLAPLGASAGSSRWTPARWPRRCCRRRSAR